MTDAGILETLKYAGFALTAASAVWGLTQRTTFDGPDGRKRLTPAGHLAALLFIGSALISATAFGFETLARDADRKAASDAAQAAHLDQARRDNLALQAELRRRAEAAEQRTLTLQTEADQRRRDLTIAENVNKGAAANLAQARVTLGQVQRLLNPLGDVRVEVTFEIDASQMESPALKQVRALAVLAERDRRLYDVAPVHWGPIGPRPFPIRSVGVREGTIYFPSPGDPLMKMIRAASVDFDITLNGSQAARENAESIGAGVYPLSWDLSFAASPRDIEYIVFLLPDKVEFTVEATIPALKVHRTGRIAAVTDLENANLIVTWSPWYFSNEMPPHDVDIFAADISFGGRSFQYARGDFRKEDIGDRLRKHFIVARMGKPTF